ncbi:scabin-related ADP-ribosyltransferase [Saccharopolyspora shandongensis]|nr:hypothetical protein [Saccharopolyspora shandongensis]
MPVRLLETARERYAQIMQEIAEANQEQVQGSWAERDRALNSIGAYEEFVSFYADALHTGDADRQARLEADLRAKLTAEVERPADNPGAEGGSRNESEQDQTDPAAESSTQHESSPGDCSVGGQPEPEEQTQEQQSPAAPQSNIADTIANALRSVPPTSSGLDRSDEEIHALLAEHDLRPTDLPAFRDLVRQLNGTELTAFRTYLRGVGVSVESARDAGELRNHVARWRLNTARDWQHANLIDLAVAATQQQLSNRQIGSMLQWAQQHDSIPESTWNVARQWGIRPDTAGRLITRYGSAIERVGLPLPEGWADLSNNQRRTFVRSAVDAWLRALGLGENHLSWFGVGGGPSRIGPGELASYRQYAEIVSDSDDPVQAWWQILETAGGEEATRAWWEQEAGLREGLAGQPWFVAQDVQRLRNLVQYHGLDASRLRDTALALGRVPDEIPLVAQHHGLDAGVLLQAAAELGADPVYLAALFPEDLRGTPGPDWVAQVRDGLGLHSPADFLARLIGTHGFGAGGVQDHLLLDSVRGGLAELIAGAETTTLVGIFFDGFRQASTPLSSVATELRNFASFLNNGVGRLPADRVTDELRAYNDQVLSRSEQGDGRGRSIDPGVIEQAAQVWVRNLPGAALPESSPSEDDSGHSALSLSAVLGSHGGVGPAMQGAEPIDLDDFYEGIDHLPDVTFREALLLQTASQLGIDRDDLELLDLNAAEFSGGLFLQNGAELLAERVRNMLGEFGMVPADLAAFRDQVTRIDRRALEDLHRYLREHRLTMAGARAGNRFGHLLAGVRDGRPSHDPVRLLHYQSRHRSEPLVAAWLLGLPPALYRAGDLMAMSHATIGLEMSARRDFVLRQGLRSGSFDSDQIQTMLEDWNERAQFRREFEQNPVARAVFGWWAEVAGFPLENSLSFEGIPQAGPGEFATAGEFLATGGREVTVEAVDSWWQGLASDGRSQQAQDWWQAQLPVRDELQNQPWFDEFRDVERIRRLVQNHGLDFEQVARLSMAIWRVPDEIPAAARRYYLDSGDGSGAARLLAVAAELGTEPLYAAHLATDRIRSGFSAGKTADVIRAEIDEIRAMVRELPAITLDEYFATEIVDMAGVVDPRQLEQLEADRLASLAAAADQLPAYEQPPKFDGETTAVPPASNPVGEPPVYDAEFDPQLPEEDIDNTPDAIRTAVRALQLTSYEVLRPFFPAFRDIHDNNIRDQLINDLRDIAALQGFPSPQDRQLLFELVREAATGELGAAGPLAVLGVFSMAPTLWSAVMDPISLSVVIRGSADPFDRLRAGTLEMHGGWPTPVGVTWNENDPAAARQMISLLASALADRDRLGYLRQSGPDVMQRLAQLAADFNAGHDLAMLGAYTEHLGHVPDELRDLARQLGIDEENAGPLIFLAHEMQLTDPMRLGVLGPELRAATSVIAARPEGFQAVPPSDAWGFLLSEGTWWTDVHQQLVANGVIPALDPASVARHLATQGRRALANDPVFHGLRTLVSHGIRVGALAQFREYYLEQTGRSITPEDWTSGEVTDLLVRWRHDVGPDWRDGELAQARITDGFRPGPRDTEAFQNLWDGNELRRARFAVAQFLLGGVPSIPEHLDASDLELAAAHLAALNGVVAAYPDFQADLRQRRPLAMLVEAFINNGVRRFPVFTGGEVSAALRWEGWLGDLQAGAEVSLPTSAFAAPDTTEATNTVVFRPAPGHAWQSAHLVRDGGVGIPAGSRFQVVSTDDGQVVLQEIAPTVAHDDAVQGADEVAGQQQSEGPTGPAQQPTDGENASQTDEVVTENPETTPSDLETSIWATLTQTPASTEADDAGPSTPMAATSTEPGSSSPWESPKPLLYGGNEAGQVMRFRTGDRVLLLDRVGAAHLGTWSEGEGGQVTLEFAHQGKRFNEETDSEEPAQYRVHLTYDENTGVAELNENANDPDAVPGAHLEARTVGRGTRKKFAELEHAVWESWGEPQLRGDQVVQTSVDGQWRRTAHANGIVEIVPATGNPSRMVARLEDGAYHWYSGDPDNGGRYRFATKVGVPQPVEFEHHLPTPKRPADLLQVAAVDRSIVTPEFVEEIYRKIVPRPLFRQDLAILFRVARPWETLAAVIRHGFRPRNPENTYSNGDNVELPEYVSANESSMYVSTTRAANFIKGADQVLRFSIFAPGGISVNHTIGLATRFHHEREVAFPLGIHPEAIVGVETTKAGFTDGDGRKYALGEFVLNPRFLAKPSETLTGGGELTGEMWDQLDREKGKNWAEDPQNWEKLPDAREKMPEVAKQLIEVEVQSYVRERRVKQLLDIVDHESLKRYEQPIADAVYNVDNARFNELLGKLRAELRARSDWEATHRELVARLDGGEILPELSDAVREIAAEAGLRLRMAIGENPARPQFDKHRAMIGMVLADSGEQAAKDFAAGLVKFTDSYPMPQGLLGGVPGPFERSAGSSSNAAGPSTSKAETNTATDSAASQNHDPAVEERRSQREQIADDEVVGLVNLEIKAFVMEREAAGADPSEVESHLLGLRESLQSFRERLTQALIDSKSEPDPRKLAQIFKELRAALRADESSGSTESTFGTGQSASEDLDAEANRRIAKGKMPMRLLDAARERYAQIMQEIAEAAPTETHDDVAQSADEVDVGQQQSEGPTGPVQREAKLRGGSRDAWQSPGGSGSEVTGAPAESSGSRSPQHTDMNVDAVPAYAQVDGLSRYGLADEDASTFDSLFNADDFAESGYSIGNWTIRGQSIDDLHFWGAVSQDGRWIGVVSDQTGYPVWHWYELDKGLVTTTQFLMGGPTRAELAVVENSSATPPSSVDSGEQHDPVPDPAAVLGTDQHGLQRPPFGGAENHLLHQDDISGGFAQTEPGITAHRWLNDHPALVLDYGLLPRDPGRSDSLKFHVNGLGYTQFVSTTIDPRYQHDDRRYGYTIRASKPGIDVRKTFGARNIEWFALEREKEVAFLGPIPPQDIVEVIEMVRGGYGWEKHVVWTLNGDATDKPAIRDLRPDSAEEAMTLAKQIVDMEVRAYKAERRATRSVFMVDDSQLPRWVNDIADAFQRGAGEEVDQTRKALRDALHGKRTAAAESSQGAGKRARLDGGSPATRNVSSGAGSSSNDAGPSTSKAETDTATDPDFALSAREDPGSSNDELHPLVALGLAPERISYIGNEFEQLARGGSLEHYSREIAGLPGVREALAAIDNSIDSLSEPERSRLRAWIDDAVLAASLVPVRETARGDLTELDHTAMLQRHEVRTLTPDRLEEVLAEIAVRLGANQNPFTEADSALLDSEYDPGAPLVRRLTEVSFINLDPGARPRLREDELFKKLLESEEALLDSLFAASGHDEQHYLATCVSASLNAQAMAKTPTIAGLLLVGRDFSAQIRNIMRSAKESNTPPKWAAVLDEHDRLFGRTIGDLVTHRLNEADTTFGQLQRRALDLVEAGRRDPEAWAELSREWGRAMQKLSVLLDLDTGKRTEIQVLTKKLFPGQWTRSFAASVLLMLLDRPFRRFAAINDIIYRKALQRTVYDAGRGGQEKKFTDWHGELGPEECWARVRRGGGVQVGIFGHVLYVDAVQRDGKRAYVAYDPEKSHPDHYTPDAFLKWADKQNAKVTLIDPPIRPYR